jgi:AraC-like DNA-binding protein
VLLVELFERPGPFTFEATSLPGHLIQVVMHGRVHQVCNGRAYDLVDRSAIWYHEDELVLGESFEPWLFYSINFIAPSLPPPDFQSRLIIPPWRTTLAACKSLHAAWHHPSMPAQQRNLAVHAALHDLLACLVVPTEAPIHMDEKTRLWWHIETEVRKRLDERLNMSDLSNISGTSIATIVRSCLHAVSMSPMRRLKRMRMSLAKGLLTRPELSVSDIASRIGYSRIHEFSRDYRKHFGVAPSRDREPAV